MSKKKSKATQEKPAEGLGDVVEKVTRKTGVKKAVKKVFDKLGVDCGCDKRQEKLNKLFPFKHNPKCMRKEDHDFYKTVKGKTKLTHDQKLRIATIHAYLFNHKYHVPCTSCAKPWIKFMTDIDKVFSTYGTTRKV